jgi:hypothetical protein
MTDFVILLYYSPFILKWGFLLALACPLLHMNILERAYSFYFRFVKLQNKNIQREGTFNGRKNIC